MTTFIGPTSAAAGLPGGLSQALQVTAAGVIKALPGFLARIWVQAPGTTSGALTLNDTNNTVGAQTITGITQAANAVITVSTGGASNPFAVGNSFAISGVTGMTQINNLTGLVTGIGGSTGAWTITTAINSTAFTAYSSGGSIAGVSAVNQINSIAFGSLTAGQVIIAEWPCTYGICVSAVPGGGSPVYSISYT